MDTADDGSSNGQVAALVTLSIEGVSMWVMTWKTVSRVLNSLSLTYTVDIMALGGGEITAQMQ